MKKFLRILTLALLLFLAIGAIFGGYVLMKDPSGGILQMPVENMKNSLFSDYFIPGIILFVCNGLFSLAIFILGIVKYRHYPWLVIFQGCTLTIWIVVQLFILQSFHFFHAIFGGMGIILILLGTGLLLKK